MTDLTEPKGPRFCPFEEDNEHGAGCIKEEGHEGAHLVTRGDLPEEDW